MTPTFTLAFRRNAGGGILFSFCFDLTIPAANVALQAPFMGMAIEPINTLRLDVDVFNTGLVLTNPIGKIATTK